eukprot:TRINITY_DN63385_c0_g1_i1.p1 TRINITY_DN63385_c0_g1~~TRINITY_DN63385_c0_g1_i1.p1  ORF type:complete len:704 (+),score=106.61 TRINITY_DN63385_c0_g1_i1:239-2350(+)
MSAIFRKAEEQTVGSPLKGETEHLNKRDLTVIIEQQEREIAALREALSSLSSSAAPALPQDVPPCANALRALQRGLTTSEDVRAVGALCKQLVGMHWQRLQDVFFKHVQRARDALPKRVLQWEDSLPEDWHKDAWYLLYVQDMGVEEAKEEGDFDSLRAMLPYLKRQGFRNVCVLPHYESPMADGGYDVSRYETRKSLGGEAAFSRFMDDAFEHGIRVATDGIFNHTSTEHEWFQRALHGEEKYINYYVQRNGREKIAEVDRDGDIICRYRDPDGTLSERAVVFPDIDRTHGIWVAINGKTYQFYRSFYPFQVDLNLLNVNVVEEIFAVLGRELCSGVLAKRMDAALYWIKKAGTNAEGLEEGRTLLALFKAFVKHVNARAVLMPEVVRDSRFSARYIGTMTKWNRVECASEGDLMGAYEMQAALRESTYLGTVAPFWRAAFEADVLGKHGEWLNMLEHHDETYMGFFPREVRRWMAEYIRSHNGLLFKNGMSAGGRLADFLGNSQHRLRAALVALYLAPGTPMVYQGTEAGTQSNWEYARAQVDKMHSCMQKLGVYVSKSACFDARWLQRGAINKTHLEHMEMYSSTSAVVRRLNAIRARCDALRSGALVAVDGGHADVLCVGRGGGDARALLGVVNFAPAEREVCVPLRQLRTLWGTRWRGRDPLRLCDELGGEDVVALCDGAQACWRVPPFGANLLRPRE